MVKVPVLSDAIISVEPRVSTAGNLRTIELRLARALSQVDRRIRYNGRQNLQEWLQQQAQRQPSSLQEAVHHE